MHRRTLAIVALISLTLIPLELVWTRIFSAEFFYTFAFLVLSLAVAGLGLGALTIRLFPTLARGHRLGAYLTLTGLAALAGPILVFQLHLEFSRLFSSPMMMMKFVVVTILLMAAFFFGGMSLALIFRRHFGEMPRLYMADLLAAGLGVPLVICAMNVWGTPMTTFLVAVPVLLAALAVGRMRSRIASVTLLVLVFVLAPRAESLLEVQREERAPVIYKHWDAMSKIKVFDYDGLYRGINIDNIANSSVYPFDGKWDEVDTAEAQWGIDVSYLIQQFDSCTFLSLGAGGGSDVLQALIEGATEVHAVEVNPHINYMMMHGDPDRYVPVPPKPDTGEVTDTLVADSAAADSVADAAAEGEERIDSDTVWRPITLAEYSGHIYQDPRVRVVTEDARAYVRRHRNQFDVIYSLSSNSWAALASGAMALAENYLFTSEAFEDYWRALSDSGFMMMEHQVYMPRLVTEVMQALERQGVDEVTNHFAVYDLPQRRRNILLLSKRPLTNELRTLAFGELTEENFGAIHLLYPAAHDSTADNLINRIVTEGWVAEADSAPVEISPVSDDRPFIAQMGLWRNLEREKLDRVIPYADFYGFPLSQMIMLIILAIVVIILVPLNLVPYLRPGPHLRAVPWLYFFLLGMAFMAVEIVLIHKYGLLIGPSVYSIATVLVTMLIAAGLGSRWSKRFPDTVAFAGIVLWLVLDALVIRHVLYSFGGLPMGGRIAVTAIWLLPVGFFMGMPFPKGALRVGELVDWGFAVNGTASVLGSVLVLMVAFAWGFSMALIAAAVIYVLAALLMARRSAW